DHDDDKRHRECQFELDIRDGGANRRRAVAQHLDINGGRESRDDRRQQLFDRIDDLDHIRPRLTADAKDNRRGRIVQGAELRIFSAAPDAGDVRKADRTSIAVGDDDRAVVGGARYLVIGVDCRGLCWAVEAPLRQINIGVGDRGTEIVDVEAVGGERGGIEFDANGRPLTAAYGNQSHARLLRKLLHKAQLADVFKLGQWQG